MKFRKVVVPSLISSALLLPVTAQAADGLSYTFLEGNYVVQDVDLFEDSGFFDNFVEDLDDGDGYNFRGSFALNENIFFQGGYSSTESDFSIVSGTGILVPQNQDVKTFRLGIGFNTPIADTVDFVARASYVDIDINDFNFGNVENDDLNSGDDLEDAFDDLNEDPSDGYSLDAGFRAQVVDWLELGGGVRYTDLDTGDEVSAFGNLLFEISQNLGVNLSGDFGDDISTYSLGLRYSF